MNSANLFKLIQKICNGEYTPHELTEFINLSQKIAISYLKYLELNGRNIRARKSEGINELEDVAIDCIAGLFMRNEKGEFVQLTRYFGKIIETDVPLTDAHLMSLLRRLVVKKTKQELSRIFKERDPESAKIIRNIKVAIRNSKKFRSFKEMGREFVYIDPKIESEETTPNNDDYPALQQNSDDNGGENLRKHSIPERVLFHYFLERYIPSDSISTMLEKIMGIVISLPEYQNYLAVDLIANIIREVTFQHAYERLSNDVDYRSPIHDIQIKEIDQINQSVIKTIHHKIHTQYLRKNKITPQKAAIYCRAISDYINELTQDKTTDSNFQYLKRYIPTLTQKSYREHERSIFEYLVKLTKKSLRKKLRELL